MDLSAINPVLLIAALIAAATPVLLAALGELVVERSGVLNLGVEGMMILGACAGFIAAVETGSPTMGFAVAALAGAVLAAVFALLTQVLLANQVASGLAEGEIASDEDLQGMNFYLEGLTGEIPQ